MSKAQRCTVTLEIVGALPETRRPLPCGNSLFRPSGIEGTPDRSWRRAMGAMNERKAKQAIEPKRRERQTDAFDPYFSTERRTGKRDQNALFDPHFPMLRRDPPKN